MMGDYDEGWIYGLPPENQKQVWMLVKDLWGNLATTHAKWNADRSVWQVNTVGWSALIGKLEAVAWQPLFELSEGR